MSTDFWGSFKTFIDQRNGNPFWFQFLLSWIVWNHDFVLAVLLIRDYSELIITLDSLHYYGPALYCNMSFPCLYIYSPIQQYILSSATFHYLILPLLSALFITTLIPFALKPFYSISKKHKKDFVNIKNVWAASETFTAEEKQNLRAEIEASKVYLDEVQLRSAKTLSDQKTKYKNRLQELVVEQKNAVQKTQDGRVEEIRKLNSIHSEEIEVLSDIHDAEIQELKDQEKREKEALRHQITTQDNTLLEYNNLCSDILPFIKSLLTGLQIEIYSEIFANPNSTREEISAKFNEPNEFNIAFNALEELNYIKYISTDKIQIVQIANDRLSVLKIIEKSQLAPVIFAFAKSIKN